jgi:hypothetical protein
LAILVGGIFIGGYVDKTKSTRSPCLAMTATLDPPEAFHRTRTHSVDTESCGFGYRNLRYQRQLAVDVTYPGDRNSSRSVQQIGGNLISALWFPLPGIGFETRLQIMPRIPWLASEHSWGCHCLVDVSDGDNRLFLHFF